MHAKLTKSAALSHVRASAITSPAGWNALPKSSLSPVPPAEYLLIPQDSAHLSSSVAPAPTAPHSSTVATSQL